ncbi:ribosome maturation factor RimM [Telluribacter sp. SYSU D00476]|uniref:ribosome maturation factor RimM n=1 Tax=Telluribacter sp. SYSU D00476 TaxID=2811430 RepID=UPI001FF2AFEA|nr:ribosome maturation factor RimM [Telluribacter sp. SYSU D00476]
MAHENYYLLGYIVRTHGTKGDVTIHLDVDYPEDYEEVESLFVEIKGELVPYFVEDMNIQKQNKAIVRLEDVDSIEQAQALVGSALYMPIEELEELGEGGFYYHQIQGYSVVDEALGELGIIRAIYTPNTQDLIAMDYQGSEVLIPIVDDIVISADHEKKQVLVKLPEGLLDVYLGPNTDPDDLSEDDED